MNDIIWRAIKKAQIPVVKEPVGMMLHDGKRPDGGTLIPWAKGKPMAWDVTIPDTFAESHIHDTAITPGSAARQAAVNKVEKYHELVNSHIFFPVAIETAGSWHHQAVELIQEIGKRITEITKDPRETVYLFQRLSMALQWGNYRASDIGRSQLTICLTPFIVEIAKIRRMAVYAY